MLRTVQVTVPAPKPGVSKGCAAVLAAAHGGGQHDQSAASQASDAVDDSSDLMDENEGEGACTICYALHLPDPSRPDELGEAGQIERAQPAQVRMWGVRCVSACMHWPCSSSMWVQFNGSLGDQPGAHVVQLKFSLRRQCSACLHLIASAEGRAANLRYELHEQHAKPLAHYELLGFCAGAVPNVTCPAALCGRAFHAACLAEWLGSVPSSRRVFDTIFGSCPFCQGPIGVSTRLTS